MKVSSKWESGPGFEASPIGNIPNKITKMVRCHRLPTEMPTSNLWVQAKASVMGIRIQRVKQEHMLNMRKSSSIPTRHLCQNHRNPSPYRHSMPSSRGRFVRRLRICCICDSNMAWTLCVWLSSCPWKVCPCCWICCWTTANCLLLWQVKSEN